MNGTETEGTGRETAEAAPRATSEGLGFRPLYRQVKDMLIQRVAVGEWQPQVAIPSEFQLAAEIGVSQGTVRKALDEMAAENILVRRQGRGTFVASHDEARILFQFFKLVPDTGERVFPDSVVLDAQEDVAGEGACAALQIEPGAPVIRIRRLRSLIGRPMILEKITLSEAMFPGLARRALPNNLYGLYAAAFGVKIARAREQLKAVTLTAKKAKRLEVPAGTPALCIDRIAFGLDHRPVEWRVSVCLTDGMHYLSDLR